MCIRELVSEIELGTNGGVAVLSTGPLPQISVVGDIMNTQIATCLVL